MLVIVTSARSADKCLCKVTKSADSMRSDALNLKSADHVVSSFVRRDLSWCCIFVSCPIMDLSSSLVLENMIDEKTGNKKRAANFTPSEEAILVTIIKNYKKILECKLTDMRTHSSKAACWIQIKKEYNATSGEANRPKEVLRKKYENIKKRVKKKFADEKCYVRGTGGGPAKNIPITTVDVEIKEILGKRIEGHETEFGGDACNLEVEDESFDKLPANSIIYYDISDFEENINDPSEDTSSPLQIPSNEDNTPLCPTLAQIIPPKCSEVKKHLFLT